MRPALAVLAAVVALTACDHPQHLDPVLVCLRRHESDRGPWPNDRGYGAVESTGASTASGAYQIVNGTWRTLVRDAGLGDHLDEWPRAKDAPPIVRDAVVIHALAHGGRTHWRGSGCW